MGPEQRGERWLFSAPEAARILGVTRQAIYMAIKANQLKVHSTKPHLRIDVQDLLSYGIRTGRNPEELVNRVREETGANTGELLAWVLGGLGLLLLISALLKE